jgi:hypothetical protein
MVRHRECGPAAILTRGHDDAPVREVQGRIEGLDPRIVPLRDPVKKDIGVHIPAELELATEPTDVVGEDDHAGGDGHETGTSSHCCYLLVGQGPVTGAEIHAAVEKASDTLTTPTSL